MGKIDETSEKYKHLEESPYFRMTDEEYEYERRIIYMYVEKKEDVVYEGEIHIPIAVGEEFDWAFKTYDRIEDMAVLKETARTLPETAPWFQEVAKDIDKLVRLRKIVKSN